MGISQAEWSRLEAGRRSPKNALAERLHTVTGIPLLLILRIGTTRVTGWVWWLALLAGT